MNSFVNYFPGCDMKAFTAQFCHVECKPMASAHYSETPEKYATGTLDHVNSSRLSSEANEGVSYNSNATPCENDNFGFGLVHAVAYGYSGNTGDGKKSVQCVNHSYSWNGTYQTENFQHDEPENCTFARVSPLSCHSFSQPQEVRSLAAPGKEARPLKASTFEWMKIKRNNQKSKYFKLKLCMWLIK